MSEKSPGTLIMEAASRHYKALGTRSIEVPEWECTLYFKPVTLTEQQEIMREAANGGGLEYAYAKAIISKVTDKDGNKLFDLSHQVYLLKASYAAVTQRIGEEILSTRLEPLAPKVPGESDGERVEKNS